MLTLWTSVAKQRGVECIIESGSMSIVYLIVLTPFTDGLIRRPSRSWNTVSFRGDLKDLLVFVERSVEKISKVPYSRKLLQVKTFFANFAMLQPSAKVLSTNI